MTIDNSTPIESSLNPMPTAAAHDPHCLDFTKTHPVPVELAVHPNTHAALVRAAITANVSLPDFLVDAAWEKARELRHYKDADR